MYCDVSMYVRINEDRQLHTYSLYIEYTMIFVQKTRSHEQEVLQG